MHFGKQPVAIAWPELGRRGPREDQRQCRSFSCVTGRWCVPCVRSGTEPTSGTA